jgi:hypothetical protein
MNRDLLMSLHTNELPNRSVVSGGFEDVGGSNSKVGNHRSSSGFNNIADDYGNQQLQHENLHASPLLVHTNDNSASSSLLDLPALSGSLIQHHLQTAASAPGATTSPHLLRPGSALRPPPAHLHSSDCGGGGGGRMDSFTQPLPANLPLSSPICSVAGGFSDDHRHPGIAPVSSAQPYPAIYHRPHHQNTSTPPQYYHQHPQNHHSHIAIRRPAIDYICPCCSGGHHHQHRQATAHQSQPLPLYHFASNPNNNSITNSSRFQPQYHHESIAQISSLNSASEILAAAIVEKIARDTVAGLYGVNTSPTSSSQPDHDGGRMRSIDGLGGGAGGGDSNLTHLPVQKSFGTHQKRKYKCDICLKRFTRPSSLQQHMRAHTGEKPFVCDRERCGKRFSILSNLRRHLKIHDGGVVEDVMGLVGDNVSDDRSVSSGRDGSSHGSCTSSPSIGQQQQQEHQHCEHVDGELGENQVASN